MTKAAARTGASPTAMVALEQYFPEKQCIIEDDLAYRILPFSMRAFVWLVKSDLGRVWMVRATEKDAPGLWGGMLCRKRYIDEKLTDSVNRINAVVNLGAGFDTRAYSLPVLSYMPVWEADQPENIQAKKVRLCKLFGTVPSHVRLVPIDFDREDLGSVLASHGYSADKRTFFIWEAVTQYLTETGIRATFNFLSKAESGSRLAFTYIRKDFLDGRVMYGWENIYNKYVKNKIWLFGMEPEEWPGFLEGYGWKIIEHIGYEELAERYVRPTGRELASTPVERIIYAEKV
ncbi:MAG: SAM-dependent methyltransferase [Methanosarcina mazei]|uniref:Methyltransferase n=1 Tax=Methanosarcina mazei TaxID=2209 RepID=A0A0F8ED95_METMZ|nr:SAM-dependent methyltransferase [Methanosarcina mazei]KKG32598.1 methyltransferase [Methanosarcina mazei]KKG37731.1 methyltransferase [Methanosarcina mazei]KKG59524.1 methyltransferase [Methanosarcina mazei]KKG70093.1 methyltransferase [Methanosarcina mazei]KKH22810.1 methyltransferase [Methanosarcina mazei]